MGPFSRFKRKSATPADDATSNEKPVEDDVFSPYILSNEPGVDAAEALDVMTDAIYRSAWPLGWFPPVEVASDDWTDKDEVVTGVCIRSKYGAIRSCPSDHRGFRAFEEAVVALNAKIAIKIRCKSVDVAMRFCIETNPELYELFIDSDTRIQVLNNIEELGTARKNQFAAFVRDEAVLVVWADRVDQVIPAAATLEKRLVAFLWSDESDQFNSRKVFARSPISPSTTGFESHRSSRVLLSEAQVSRVGSCDEQEEDIAQRTRKEEGLTVDAEDPVKADFLAARKARPVGLIAPVISGLSSALAVVLMSFGVRAILIRYIYDGDASRFALLAVLPFVIFVAAFPCNVVVGTMFQLFGPIAQFHRNSAYYSAIRPNRDTLCPLLPITVQMPVYKESLDDVIIPTLESVQKAITTFERQGGSVNVIVCDDGLQLLSPEERNQRIKFYADKNVAYVARPPHEKDGFQRRGRFKKAGNLNWCNFLSLRVEEIMDDMRPHAMTDQNKTVDWWSETDERVLYDHALARGLAETQGETWANGNIRIGEIVLLIDSDTRIPEDCFIDASLEMTQCPEVAIIQHASGAMKVAHHFFENGMAFFTEMLQVGISLIVANGDTAPFVGHNAFLRWSALQEVAQVDPYDNRARVWSESHVSEDFQIALTLQSKAWVLRWATYSNLAFEEGVSLTCADELSRWQKYAWGCSEIIFNPIRYWPTRSPFSKLLRTFIWSPLPSHSKWSIIAYMASYYAIGMAWSLSLLNFVLIGVFDWGDTFYLTSWSVFLVCILLFQGVNQIALSVVRYRLKIAHAGRTNLAQIKWIPYFTVFFSGLSFPVALPLICHVVGINMSWTSTTKSVTKSNFFLQVPKIFKRFWAQITLSIMVIAGIIISTTSLVPVQYRVSNVTAIVPIAITYAGHLLWPFALDPYFTTFSF